MVDYQVRAMTWNIWWRFGPRWRERQPGILTTIERFTPDVVGLQEVWSTGERTQADELAEALGFYATFAAPSYRRHRTRRWHPTTPGLSWVWRYLAGGPSCGAT
jgi:endonuclease/exonuclease/phosphatase family metal-dependent hydrolase